MNASASTTMVRGSDFELRLVNVQTRQQLVLPRVPQMAPNGTLFTPGSRWVAAFSANGRGLVVGSRGRRIQRFRLNLPQSVELVPVARRASLNQGFGMNAQAFSGNLEMVARGQDTTVRLISLTSGEMIGEPLVHPCHVEAACFASNDELLVTIGVDGIVRQWPLPRQWTETATGVSDRAERQLGIRLGESDVVEEHPVADSLEEGLAMLAASARFRENNSLSDRERAALALRFDQRLDEAATAFAEWTTARPKDWQPDVLSINVLLKSGRVNEAEAAYQRGVQKLDAETVAAWLELYYRREKNDEEADPSIVAWLAERILQLQPSGRDQAAIRLDRARDHLKNKEIHKAREELTAIIQQDGDALPARRDRASLLGRMQLWDVSLADRKVIAELEPDNHFHHYRLLALYLQQQDTDSFLETWRFMHKRWAKSDEGREAERLAKPALLLPVEGDDLKEALRLADETFAAEDARYRHWDVACKALAEYRRGHFQQSIDFSNDAVERFIQAERRWGISFSRFVTAMAHHQLGDADAARSAYYQGVDIHDDYFFRLMNGTNPMVDWLFHEVIRREAAALLKIEAFEAARVVPDTSNWRVLFEDDFDRDEPGKQWQAGSEWAIEDGAVRGTPSKWDQRGSWDTKPMTLNAESLPATLEIEFETWWPQEALAEIKLTSGSRWAHVVGLSGCAHPYRLYWNEPGIGPHVFDFHDANAATPPLFGRRWVRPQGFKYEVGRRYRVRVLQEPDWVRLSVDDEEVVSVRLSGEPGQEFSFYGLVLEEGGTVHFDNLRIRTPK